MNALGSRFDQYEHLYLEDEIFRKEEGAAYCRQMKLFQLLAMVPRVGPRTALIAGADRDAIYFNLDAAGFYATVTDDRLQEMIRCGLQYSALNDSFFLYV